MKDKKIINDVKEKIQNAANIVTIEVDKIISNNMGRYLDRNDEEYE